MSAGAAWLERATGARVGPFLLVETLPTAVLLPLAVAEVVAGGAGVVSGPLLVVVPAVLVPVVLLLWRRRRPLAVLAAVVGCFAVPLVVWGATYSMAAVYTLVVAVFACGAYADRPRAYAAVPMAMALLLLGSSRDPTASLSDTWGWSLNALWVFGLGALLRHQVSLTRRVHEAETARERAAEAERRLRLARDVHDALAHSLSIIVVQAEAADEVIGVRPDQARRALGRIQDTGRASLAEVRALVDALRDDAQSPSDARAPGLDGVLSLVDSFRQSGLPVALVVEGDVDAVPGPAQETAYRVVQEALTNTLRHAGRVPTVVELSVEADRLQVEVRDEGEAGTAAEPGNGLRGMRERVESAGGRVLVGTKPDGGYSVSATFPVRSTT